jgi:hypothetical protein
MLISNRVSSPSPVQFGARPRRESEAPGVSRQGHVPYRSGRANRPGFFARLFSACFGGNRRR